MPETTFDNSCIWKQETNQETYCTRMWKFSCSIKKTLYYGLIQVSYTNVDIAVFIQPMFTKRLTFIQSPLDQADIRDYNQLILKFMKLYTATALACWLCALIKRKTEPIHSTKEQNLLHIKNLPLNRCTSNTQAAQLLKKLDLCAQEKSSKTLLMTIYKVQWMACYIQ